MYNTYQAGCSRRMKQLVVSFVFLSLEKLSSLLLGFPLRVYLVRTSQLYYQIYHIDQDLKIEEIVTK